MVRRVLALRNKCSCVPATLISGSIDLDQIGWRSSVERTSLWPEITDNREIYRENRKKRGRRGPPYSDNTQYFPVFYAFCLHDALYYRA